MARKGREFELAYKHLYDMLDKEIYKVTSPAFPIDKTTGKGREVDVLIEYIDCYGKPRRISIECRDRSKVQDITWIEQLVQKREDLDLDFTIATTTTSFSDGAIAKAKYHGILIEEAEMPTSSTIDELRKTTFVDFFFFKFTLLEFSLYVDKLGFISLKDYLQRLNIFAQHEVINELNTNFFYSFEPTDILEKHAESLDFFSDRDNHIVVENSDAFDSTCPPCFSNVMWYKYKVRIEPRKVSLPIQESISVFSVENHSNIKYRGSFKNDSDFFSIAYIDGELILDFGIKKRKYWRLSSSTLHLNTIIPGKTAFDSQKLIQYCIDNHKGEFDLSQIL